MNSKGNKFGFGRPSGIRPPTVHFSNTHDKPEFGSASSKSSVPSLPSVPSSTSSRKSNRNQVHLPGSASSSSGAGSGFATRKSIYANLRSNPFASGRKSVTAKLGSLFSLTPQSNRQSFQPNTASSSQSNRRSSIGGNRHLTDNRPLSDPSFQKQCVTKVIEFLTNNPFAPYPHIISKNLSTRPTNGDISKIFEVRFYLNLF